MTPVAAAGWNPLAGLGVEALRPIRGDAPALAPAPAADAELIGLCERYAALHTAWLQVCDEWSCLDPNTPLERALQAQMDAITDESMKVGAELGCRPATTQAGLLALARAALRSMVADPRRGRIDLTPGPDNLPICRRPDDDGVLALTLINSVIAFSGGRAMRFVNAPATPPPSPPPPVLPQQD